MPRVRPYRTSAEGRVEGRDGDRPDPEARFDSRVAEDGSGEDPDDRRANRNEQEEDDDVDQPGGDPRAHDIVRRVEIRFSFGLDRILPAYSVGPVAGVRGRILDLVVGSAEPFGNARSRDAYVAPLGRRNDPAEVGLPGDETARLVALAVGDLLDPVEHVFVPWTDRPSNSDSERDHTGKDQRDDGERLEDAREQQEVARHPDQGERQWDGHPSIDGRDEPDGHDGSEEHAERPERGDGNECEKPRVIAQLTAHQ